MTSIINRILLGLLAAILAAGTYEYVVLKATQSRLTTAEASLTRAQAETGTLRRTLKSTNAALRARAQAIAEAQARVLAARKELDHALQENPGWAATPVPDAVWQRLYGDPASAPSSTPH